MLTFKYNYFRIVFSGVINKTLGLVLYAMFYINQEFVLTFSKIIWN